MQHDANNTQRLLCRRARSVQLCCVLGLLLIESLARHVRAQEIESFPKPEAPVHGDAKNGKRLYESYGCYECHGGQGQGSVLTGPRLGPNPMSFSGFVRYVRKPTGQMPPYTRKITTDEQLADMYAFLQSLPQPPDAKKTPLLSTPASAPGKTK